MESLLRYGQQRYGVVTADGVIVDGNRRALLLNKLFRERERLHLQYPQVDSCQYFMAVILPDDATKRDIEQLETIYQMGEDDKLDYNPIEKYLKCRDLQQHSFSTADIAALMDEKEGQIKEWLSILDLMDKYLDAYGYQGIYTRLEKTEGPFVDLVRYIGAYRKGSKTMASWAYDESDVSDLQQVCFDYIRARYEGKEFREIAKTGSDGCIFAYKELWNSFLKEHRQIPKDESTTEDLRRDNPNEDLSKLLRGRDDAWATAAKDSLEGNLKKHTGKLDDKRNESQPLKLLEKALDALRAVNCEQGSFYTDPGVLECVKEINDISWQMKKGLDRKAPVCQE